MTAMNLYQAEAIRSSYLAAATRSTNLAKAKGLKAGKLAATSKKRSSHRLLREIVQVAKGVLTPVNTTRAALGDNLSRDMGLR